ncbi:uncharacterized protein LOC34618901 [Cyclospora cayetanensis]|uniref:Uncharacterized protein LOC34618901 n=1 Tax=Cyclospora cayetanensis TaxID=88456 RepID=A0A6P6RXM5_9EIME|nr:uncharacterized protein LOC34618901 [Cyclospora cayetanensis]
MQAQLSDRDGSSTPYSSSGSESTGRRTKWNAQATATTSRAVPHLRGQSKSVSEAGAGATLPAAETADAAEQPLLQLVAFDDLQQTFARSCCKASRRWCCCCCYCCKQNLPLQRPIGTASNAAAGAQAIASLSGKSFPDLNNSSSSSKGASSRRQLRAATGCRCRCGSCCCNASEIATAGVASLRSTTRPNDRDSSHAHLESQLLFAGISASWDQRVRSTHGSPAGPLGSAPFVVQRLQSIHMGLPLQQQEEMRAATAANLAAVFRQEPQLQARALLELGAAEDTIPTLDLFLDYRKPRALQQHPLMQPTLQLLKRLQRFALPLYDQQLLQNACEDSVLYPKLQGLEVPFRLLTHDLLFLAAYSYLADLPAWSKPPIRLLRIVGFLLLNADLQRQHQNWQEQQSDAGDTGDETARSASAPSRHVAFATANESDAAPAVAADLEGLMLEGASPEAMEALHLQGLVLFNIQLIIKDFEATLHRIEVLCDEDLLVDGDPYEALQSLTTFLQQHGFSLHSFRFKHGSTITSSTTNGTRTSTSCASNAPGQPLTASMLQAVATERGSAPLEMHGTSRSNRRSEHVASPDVCGMQDKPVDSGVACNCCRCQGDGCFDDDSEGEPFLAASVAGDSDNEDVGGNDEDNVDGMLRPHVLREDVYSQSAGERGIGDALASAFYSLLKTLDDDRGRRKKQQDGWPRVSIHSVLYVRNGGNAGDSAADDAATAAAAAVAAEIAEQQRMRVENEQWRQQQRRQTTEEADGTGSIFSFFEADDTEPEESMLSFLDEWY